MTAFRRRTLVPRALVISISMLAVVPHVARAQWTDNGRAVCTAADNQAWPQMVSDGSGGVILVWQDARNGGDMDIYAQHVSSGGVVDPAWPVDGAPICTVAGVQDPPLVVADGAGGAIVAWTDRRFGDANRDIYAQHVLATGVADPGWPAGGTAVCSAANIQYGVSIVGDGAGGALVAWQDARGSDYDVYAERVLSTGTVDPAWPANGRAVCSAAGDQVSPQLVSDGAGGAILAWTDHRGGTDDVYAQHVAATGAVDPAWPIDGRALCTAANDQTVPMLIADGAGGAVVVWQDDRIVFNYDVYAQHVLSGGAVDPAWPADGSAVCTSANAFNPRLITDGVGGAIIAWYDIRSGNYDVYAQRLKSGGVVDPGWPMNGRALCTAAGDQLYPTLSSDGAGGALVFWQDARGAAGDVYGCRVLSSGALDSQWPANGAPLCVATGDQYRVVSLPDGAGGAIVAWQDGRSGNDDIYVHRIGGCGELANIAQCHVDGEPVCTVSGLQQNPTVTADGSGGAIVAWQDNRNGGSNLDVFAQHVLPTGSVDGSWPSGGTAVATALNNQQFPVAVGDGAGGAILAWQDYRNGTSNADVYAQHVLSAGGLDPAWPPAGVAVCVALNTQQAIAIVSDGAGGALIAWQDSRSGSTNTDIYAQRVRSTGTVDPAWPANGRALCTAALNQGGPSLVADGANGAIVAWYDVRNGTSNTDIYAGHLLASGVVDPAWPADGRAVCSAPNTQNHPSVVADGAGGAVVAWQDFRDGLSWDIYARHVLATGAVDPAWPVDGRVLCAFSGDQQNPTVASNGAGGAIVAWTDTRAGTSDVYAQVVRATGDVDPAWPGDGLALCTAPLDQLGPTIVADGVGGAIVTWYDNRTGGSDVFAQHALSSGAVDPAWPADGLSLCSAVNGQIGPSAAGDGSGGAFVAWSDSRHGVANADIYSQHVRISGALAAVRTRSPGPSWLVMRSPYPNPVSLGALIVPFDLASPERVSARVIDVAGRCVRTLTAGRSFPAGHQSLVWDGKGESGHPAEDGVYFIQLRAGSASDIREVVRLR